MSSDASGSDEHAEEMNPAGPEPTRRELGASVVGLIREVGALKEKNKALAARIDDVQRQYSKHCLVFSGPGLKPLPGELPTATVCRIALARWGRFLRPNEMRASHPPRGSKKCIVAEFLDCKELSNFAFMLNNPANRRGNKVFCNLFLASANDRKLAAIATKMKSEKKIRNFKWVSSGRLVIVFSDGKSKVYDRAEELELARAGSEDHDAQETKD